MFGSEILDVALGLTLVFLLVSLLGSAIREAIESSMKSRAVYLERGIRELLGDQKGDGLATLFYHHPLIYSLFHGKFEYKEKRWAGGGLPTYIPAKNFALALMDMTMRGPQHSEYIVGQRPTELTIQGLRDNVRRLKQPALQRAMTSAIDHAQGDLDKVRQNLQDWFDSSMDRVSGWYKRDTHTWLFGIGIVLAGLLNINSVQIADTLWRDKALRQAIATRAEAIARDPHYQQLAADSAKFREEDAKRISADLASLDLPIGWSSAAEAELYRSTISVKASLRYWTVALAGWLMTALAVTLGAPFWFDILNKIIVVRSTVKPHEKSPEEASEDRQDKGKSESSVKIVAAPAQPPAQQPAAPRPRPPAEPEAPVAAVPADKDFVKHEWAVGDADEGEI